MRKNKIKAVKLIPIVFVVLLLFAGIAALTQETGGFLPGQEQLLQEQPLHEEKETSSFFDGDFSPDYELAREIPEWVKPARWFRSNAGGMALEEVFSRFAALRFEYALVIDFSDSDELPEYLLPYYDSGYFIEVRRLYERGEESRLQWIFRDNDGLARLIAVFTEQGGGDEESRQSGGFIEIFDENSFLVSEYRFFDEGGKSRTDYHYKDGFFTSAVAFLWEENDEGGKFMEAYTDFYRYNRSLFLRAVERVFYSGGKISSLDDSLKIVFPRRIMDAANDGFFTSEKLNSYPEFFGDITVKENSRIVFLTDDRGRVLSQTLYDNEENIIWVIRNTWLNDRIVSIEKKEGDAELLAEYEYDSGGNRILERNLRNGVLERLVRTEGERDIEQLYLNNVVVLQAVWEDGRKISETRIK